MGLLDDAIREHLELKRRHGADPSDVARQEAEALGAAQREAAAAEEVEASLEDEPEAPFALDEAPTAEPEVHRQAEEDVTAGHQGDPLADEAFGAHQETREFSAGELQEALSSEAEATAPEDADVEDVLEETPDFLEETPEHDRLWFEQKPPKDFDF